MAWRTCRKDNYLRGTLLIKTFGRALNEATPEERGEVFTENLTMCLLPKALLQITEEKTLNTWFLDFSFWFFWNTMNRQKLHLIHLELPVMLQVNLTCFWLVWNTGSPLFPQWTLLTFLHFGSWTHSCVVECLYWICIKRWCLTGCFHVCKPKHRMLLWPVLLCWLALIGLSG